MATTAFDFVAPTTTQFQFAPVLDGETYTGIVSWNAFGRRYFLNLYTLDQTLVLCCAMVGSPPDYDISLTEGYFDTKIVWRVQNNRIEVIDP